MKPKRVRWEVSYSKINRMWRIRRSDQGTDEFKARKVDAVRVAAGECRAEWEMLVQASELTIKRRDGTIQDKRTYGKDPRRIKG